jgi:hypothetical protein
VAGPTPRNYQLRQDRLGKLVSRAAVLLDDGVSFRDFCIQHRGPTCLSDPSDLPHAASALLHRLRKAGAPSLQTTKPWTLEKLDAAIRRGPHKSTAMHSNFLRDEFADMMEAGQWVVVPYRCVRHLRGLRLSPTGVVPQKNRRPRNIVDYTFYLINQAALCLSPDSLQFGHTLRRLLQKLHRADTRRGRIYLSKTDIADAFMRVWIQADHVLSLGALIHHLPGKESMVAFPMILPMGWIDSPRYLCAVTETIADLANNHFQCNDLSYLSYSPHRLDKLADTPASAETTTAAPDNPPAVSHLPPPLVASKGPLQQPLNTVDVFMDDFIMLSQLPLEQRTAARRTLFECINAVLRPLSPDDNPRRKEPNSVKKLAQGDAAWAT